ncbi:phospholipase D-like domain-containing protein [Actinomadura parmotrematis]|uniref:phospholipase D n=1 Tax=Actinomadura parmotrematis TaxID=2864039 RepID=A0ABS7FMX8_9ACTN|nr:phospholipase D-like domain-containing protein [Actinomadura parmotrematis]MBW8481676.1 phospholipase D family protein [Actinomadura parmotrematis]
MTGGLVAVAAGAVPAAAEPQGVVVRKAAPAVPQGPRFNLPAGSTAQQGSIDLYLKRLIAHTPKGAEIDVAMFRLTTSGMAKALAAAAKRGVHVRVVVDSDSVKRAPKVQSYLREHLGTSTAKASWIVTCPTGRGCIAPAAKGVWGKNHNKFYAFSTTYGTRNVVVQTSGNATGGMYTSWNNAYTLTDATLYKAYRGYFYDLSKRRANGNYYRVRASGSRSVTFFPKATGDPIVSALDGVVCLGGTRIRLSSGEFTRDAVAQKLWWLARTGCRVQIVSGSFGTSTLKTLSTPGVLNAAPETRYFTAGQAHPAHSKYLLIDGWYFGKRAKVVMTGSHSYTNAALRHNDEAMLTLRDTATFNAYAANFGKVFGAAKGRLKTATYLKLPAPTVPDDSNGD